MVPEEGAYKSNSCQTGTKKVDPKEAIPNLVVTVANSLPQLFDNLAR